MIPKLGPMALALAIGIASGGIAALLGLPLPWMLGPMIGNTIAALLRAPLYAPTALRPVMIPVIGVMLGAAFSPAILDMAGRWVATLLLLPPFIVIAGGVSYVYYRRVARYDPVTAFFSAMPGGLNEMLILGSEAGGVDKRIALAHATRVLVVVTFVVAFFGFALDVRSDNAAGRPWLGFASLSGLDIVLLSLSAVIGAVLGTRLRLPAATLLGPMVISAGVHLAGWVEVPPPTILVIAAQIVIGTIIGCRFADTALREVLRDMGHGAASSILMILVAIGFAMLVARLAGVDTSQAFLAFSPGGLTEMSLLALAMGKDVAYISISHTARIALVIVLAPLAFRLSRLGKRG